MEVLEAAWLIIKPCLSAIGLLHIIFFVRCLWLCQEPGREDQRLLQPIRQLLGQENILHIRSCMFLLPFLHFIFQSIFARQEMEI